jgi:CPA1 family monovalent cation:H+ antiporter
MARDDPLVEVALSTVVAYAAFLAAEHTLQVSGVMATVGAGVVVGTFGTPRFTVETRAFLHQFWEYAAFVANSLIFLMVGISVSIGGVIEHIGPIGWTILIVLIARALTVYGLIPLVGRIPNSEPIDVRMRTVMFWGGLRGAISVALALVLVAEADNIGADVVSTLQVMTFGVVLFTLLVQGVTIERLINRLGLAAKPAERIEQQRRQARIYAQQAGLEELERLHDQGVLFPDLYEAMAGLYRGELARDRDNLRTHLRRYPELETDMYLQARANTLRAERSALQDAARRGLIADDVLTELTGDINDHLAALEFIEGDARQGDIVVPVEGDGD